MDRRKTIVIAAGSLGVTALLVGLVFSLGGWAYQHRRSTLHDGRLRRLVAEHPSEDRVSRGILAEPGNGPIATPASEAELRQLAAGHVQEALLDQAHERLLGRQLQQARQQPRADEAREAREQHAHDFPSRVMIRQTSRMLVAR